MQIIFSPQYIACCILVLSLSALCYFQRKKSWSLPVASVAATTALWYLVEPVYTPETMAHFSPNITSKVYLTCAIFLVGFWIFFFSLKPMFSVRRHHPTRQIRLDLPFRQKRARRQFEQIALLALSVWAILLLVGILRLNGDLAQALFPQGGRFAPQMWSRAGGSAAGPFGFVISLVGYVYTLLLASFGPFLILLRNRKLQVLVALAIAISWPAVFLGGARNAALFISAPMVIAFILFGRASPVQKALISLTSLFLLELIFEAMIRTRNIGFSFDQLRGESSAVHEGLNMASELAWILEFIDNGSLTPNWGYRYFAELANIVPRPIWPDKPLIGIDYAILRGFESSSSDIGVSTTVSTGMVGQGVVNFGQIIGPLGAAFLIAIWANTLTRLRSQGSTGRQILFMLGLALTINLGRDITLLVLYPFLFGYVFISYIEARQAGINNRSKFPRRASSIADPRL
jgi:oligosaccharide repeat unit polymerase